LIRAEGLDSFQQADPIRRVWASCAVEIELGAAISADRRTIRIREAPSQVGREPAAAQLSCGELPEGRFTLRTVCGTRRGSPSSWPRRRR
jgi:hypothetical protein